MFHSASFPLLDFLKPSVFRRIFSFVLAFILLTCLAVPTFSFLKFPASPASSAAKNTTAVFCRLFNDILFIEASDTEGSVSLLDIKPFVKINYQTEYASFILLLLFSINSFFIFYFLLILEIFFAFFILLRLVPLGWQAPPLITTNFQAL